MSDYTEYLISQAGGDGETKTINLEVFNDIEQGAGPDAERFWKYVQKGNPDDCWEWQSTRNNSGYGKFWLNHRTDLAHRVSYKFNKGPIPPTFVVRHTCDNPPCVNPVHLLIGTPKENAGDALERGLYKRGTGNGRAKLTPEQVHEIRECWHAGETQVSMARRFGVSRSAIQWILNGKNWAGVGDES